MNDTSLNFLKKLLDSPSPSGFEQPSQKIWREYVKKFSDEVKTDVMGNSFAYLNGVKKKPLIMLAGHCDEIGLMVKYIDEKGQEQQPVVIHRSSIGAFERVMAFLIEFYGGAFPAWLAPVQAVVIPISEKHNDYASKVVRTLKDNGIRTQLDNSSESMQKRIRNAEKQKVPYMLVVGDKEQESNSVAVRARGRKDLGVMSLDEFNKKITEEINKKIIF